jgi:hypothetical protein
VCHAGRASTVVGYLGSGDPDVQLEEEQAFTV